MRLGKAVMVRRDMVWRGKLGHGEARWVAAVEVCSGWISYGMESFGGWVKVGSGMVGSGQVWRLWFCGVS